MDLEGVEGERQACIFKQPTQISGIWQKRGGIMKQGGANINHESGNVTPWRDLRL
jgi:hypothetical protein